MKSEKLENIRNLILPILEDENVELVDMELKGSVGNQLLRIFVDTAEGINLNRCAELSRLISDILDIKDPLEGKYTLEVSSPGLDRPLRTIRDFQKQLGQKVRIIYHDGDQIKTIEGLVENVKNEDTVEIKTSHGNHHISLNCIEKAKIVLKW